MNEYVSVLVLLLFNEELERVAIKQKIGDIPDNLLDIPPQSLEVKDYYRKFLPYSPDAEITILEISRIDDVVIV